MTLQVLDDGVGISESKSNGMGLAIMRYRARLNGGELQIEQPEKVVARRSAARSG